MRRLMLIDNGSSRAESTLSLRRLAAALEGRLGETVHPVSLLHSSRVSPAELGGAPADTLEPFLECQVSAGHRDFLALPLFFGRGGALTGFLPEKLAAIRARHGPFVFRLADSLCPLPEGEPRLERILMDNILQTARARGLTSYGIVLVDHGSPLPQVTRVRQVLAGRIRALLDPGTTLWEAVMERREGREYDFNGERLESLLRRLAAEDWERPLILAMLFLSAGRHAGPGGDIEAICARVQADYPVFRAFPTPLAGSHPGLIDILESRCRSGGIGL